MRKVLLIGCLVAVCAVLAYVWSLNEGENGDTSHLSESDGARLVVADPISTDTQLPPLSEPDELNPEEVPITPASSLSAVFVATENLRNFVDANLEAATKGDAEAQFYIFKALAECEIFAWAAVSGDRDTKEKWMIANNNTPIARKNEISDSFDRCEKFVTKNELELTAYYGDNLRSQMWEWLKSASEGGHPVAQTMYALGLFTSDSAEARDQAVSLLAEAALSRNPEAMVYISAYYSGEDVMEEAAWALVACSYGFDCSPDSVLSKELCRLPRSCMRTETAGDILRANLGDYDFDEANRRSEEIKAAIEDSNEQNLRLNAISGFYEG